MFRKNESIFDKINKYLTKKGHELVMSVFLSDFNNHDIYIRFDYVGKLSVYKIVWVDLKFIDEKRLEDYINQQIVTKYVALQIVDKILEINKALIK